MGDRNESEQKRNQKKKITKEKIVGVQGKERG